jgi:hypothetical protein
VLGFAPVSGTPLSDIFSFAGLTITTPVTQNAGTPFTVSGTYVGLAPTALNYAVDGGGYVAMTGATISGGTWSGSVTVPTVGAHTITVQEANALSATATTSTFQVGQITLSPIVTQLTSTSFLVGGTYSGPTPAGLTYSLDGGLLVAFTSPAISGGTWSATLTGVTTAGLHTLSVTESPSTHVFSPTVTFSVVVGTVTVSSPVGTVFPGQTIGISGTYTGLVPTGVNYSFDGGAYQPVLAASIGGGTWSGFLTLPVAGFHTLTVQEAGAPTVTGSCYVYVSALPGTVVPAPTVPPVVTGSQQDFSARLRALLPRQWFPTTPYGQATTSPVLDALLAGLASAWSNLYALLLWAFLQARISTATDTWLDVCAQDYFGTRLQRRAGESDTQLRARILASLLRPAGTRAALISALNTLTGQTAASVFEPTNPGDTGGYNLGGVGRNQAGGYGDLLMPFQFLVQTPRALGGGISGVGGIYYGSGAAYGGRNVGALEYASTQMIQGAITDAEIYATVAAVIPAGTEAWVQIH